MATPQQIRNRRLNNDFKEMMNIKGSIIDWEPLVGTPPLVEEYEVTMNIRSVTDKVPNYRSEHKFHVKLPENYPQAPPQIEMTSDPVIFHPNWFTNKRWCFGTWEMSEGLGHHVVRMARTLQFDPEITNEHSPANNAARDWYVQNRNSGLFPCDMQHLPDPTKSAERKKFSINAFGRAPEDETTSYEERQEEPKNTGTSGSGGFRIID